MHFSSLFLNSLNLSFLLSFLCLISLQLALSEEKVKMLQKLVDERDADGAKVVNEHDMLRATSEKLRLLENSMASMRR